MPVKDLSLVALLRVLADPTRLRLLALLNHAELAVGEIARSLALSQSRVSNHLKILREHDLVAERRAGSFSYCRLELPAGCAAELWHALEPALANLREREADERRLAAVLADRTDSRAFFDRIAGDWDLIGSDFTRGTGLLEAVGCLVPPTLTVADVGCGTGYLARELGRRVARVICIDSSTPMLDRARENLAGLPARVEYREGTLEKLPLADAEVDAACAHMVLHHLAEPAAGLREMVRALRPGGQAICVDLLPHRETWMHTEMADARLGLDPAPLGAAFRTAGLTGVQHEMLDDAYVVEHPAGRRIQLPLFLIRGHKPAA